MKKILSVLLALIITMGAILPMTVNAAEVDRQELFEAVKARIPKELDVSTLKGIFNVLQDNKSKIFNALPEQDYLKDNGITEDNIDQIIDAIIDSTPLILKLIMIPNLTYEEAKGDIEELLNKFYGLLPLDIKKSINNYAPNEQAKLDVMARVIRVSLDEKIGKGDYNTSIGKWTSLDLKVTKSQIEKLNKEISGGSDNPLDDRHLNIINKLLEEAVKVLPSGLTDQAGSLLYDLKLIERNPVTPPPSPAPSGPSPTPTTPSPTKAKVEIEVPDDLNLPASGTVGKEATEITEKGGTTVIAVKESEAIEAIESLRSAAGKAREASVVFNLDTIKSLNYNIELSDKLIESLIKNKVNLEIKTGDSEITIPASVLDQISITSGSKLEFRIAEVSEDEVKEAAPETGDVKKVIDINLVLVKDKEETIITRFKTHITVSLDVEGMGDKDKLAVYYLNEEKNSLEFVTGKIIGNKIQLKLNHFSKYVILESKLSFEDVKDHWSRKYVESMAAKNVVNGYEDGTFRPDNEITRAEFAKMIVSALELDLSNYNGGFSDIKATDWYADYVATIVRLGLARGYGDGTFKPNNKITRAEMAVILGNALDLEVKPDEINSLLNKFTDLDTLEDWAKLGVSKVIKAGIMVGSDDKFNPRGTATRGEVATAIYRLYNR